MATTNLAQRTFKNTEKALRFFKGQRNEHNTQRKMKKNVDELFRSSKEDIKTASEQGRFNCVVYYKKFNKEERGYNRGEMIDVAKLLDEEGFKTTYEESLDGVMLIASWDNRPL